MATYTPNYNLSKPESTDEFGDFLESYNDNMDIIDTISGGGGGVTDVEVNGTSVVTGGVAEVTVPTATSDLANDSGFIDSSALTPYVLSSSLASVATSGSYNDLLDKPTIPDELADLTSDSTHRTVTDTEKATWNAKVSDNPTFTEASARANISSGESFAIILGKIKKFFTDLKTVAFSGSYNDLSDKPTIPDELNDLSDVNISNPTDGELLTYDSTNSEWVNTAPLFKVINGELCQVYDDGN